MHHREAAPPAPGLEDADDPRLVLRDGSVASVRPASPAEAPGLARVFCGLSEESRRLRFMGAIDPPSALIEQFCATDPLHMLTLVAVRRVSGQETIVATATYIAVAPAVAEVAFAVADAFQGKGIASLLLERLATSASATGFSAFVAETFADNAAMLDVFRDSGFVTKSRTTMGSVHVELTLTPSAEAVRSAEARRRNATVASLAPILAPRSVAVIGASADRLNIGARVLLGLRSNGFAGALHAVHPQATHVQGIAAVPTARDLPSGVDLAIVAVPAPAVLGVAEDCAAAGVKALVVLSAGFAETGAEGRARQKALVEKVRTSGMRMVGPNCMGLLNLAPSVRMNASFSPIVPTPGRVAFSSQSGALGIAVLALARSRGVGLSAFVSIGNKGDVSTNDLLEYWESDPTTRVVLLYLESFGNPRRFSRLARRIGRTKPIVALKAGRTAAGRQAAGSHTAALASRSEAADALFLQCGVIRAETMDEMFDIAAFLDAQPIPPGRRVAILTNGGGPGILAADACEAAKLEVAALSTHTTQDLASFLPASASVQNPVDLIASAEPEAFRRAVRTLMLAPEVDALIVIVTPIDPAKTQAIWTAAEAGLQEARAAGATGKPIVACAMADDARSERRHEPDAEAIPVCMFPENAVRALGKAADYGALRSRPAGFFCAFDDLRPEDARAVCRTALAARGEGWLTTGEIRRVLSAFGIPLVDGGVAATPGEACDIAAGVGYPVVAKLASTAITHKSDLGLVRTNLVDERAVRQATDELLRRAAELPGCPSEGVLVEPMRSGLETIVGVTSDPSFGRLVAFGMGGTAVEVYADVRFRIAPLTDRDAADLVREPRASQLLRGLRGQAPRDVASLEDMLLRVSCLADEIHEITELDLNPVLVQAEGQGAVAVDARIFVRR